VIHWLSPHTIAMIDCLADAYGTTPDVALARAVRRAFVASCRAEAEEGERVVPLRVVKPAVEAGEGGAT
jgi:hypothetical protein